MTQERWTVHRTEDGYEIRDENGLQVAWLGDRPADALMICMAPALVEAAEALVDTKTQVPVTDAYYVARPEMAELIRVLARATGTLTEEERDAAAGG